jgi:hypothetical protein
MKKTMLATILCSMLALPASADTISGGKITSVDPGGTAFHYSKKKKSWTFKVTDATSCGSEIELAICLISRPDNP